jgi:hypothetical protein
MFCVKLALSNIHIEVLTEQCLPLKNFKDKAVEQLRININYK